MRRRPNRRNRRSLASRENNATIRFAQLLIVPSRYVGIDATRGECFAVAGLAFVLSTAFWVAFGGAVRALGRRFRARAARTPAGPAHPGLSDAIRCERWSPRSCSVRGHQRRLEEVSALLRQRDDRRVAIESVRFRALYRVWKQDRETAFASCGSHTLDEAVTAGAGRVETLELGHRYGHLSPLAAIA